jgi:hypothetical protein
LFTGTAYALSNTDEQKTTMGDSIRITQQSAFFDRYIDKAVKHARAAETAGTQGYATDLLRHAQWSLDQAQQAQRAGNVPGLSEGIVALREALSVPFLADRTGSGDTRPGSIDKTTNEAGIGTSVACASQATTQGIITSDDPACLRRDRQSQATSLQEATDHVRDARIKLSKAGGIRATDTRPAGAIAINTGSMAGGERTVSGYLISDEASSRRDGGNHYFVRDRSGTDLPITLTQDMTRDVRAGDKVKAQVDADGHVLPIVKDHSQNP